MELGKDAKDNSLSKQATQHNDHSFYFKLADDWFFGLSHPTLF